MLTALIGRDHQVVTGVALLRTSALNCQLPISNCRFEGKNPGATFSKSEIGNSTSPVPAPGVFNSEPGTRNPELATLVISHADIAHVRLGHVPEPDLQAYLDSDDWRGKAGAYNLSELQHRWPLTVTGDPTTVVGLPMSWLMAALAGWSVHPQSASGCRVQTPDCQLPTSNLGKAAPAPGFVSPNRQSEIGNSTSHAPREKGPP
jgi:hypothetical protein